MKAFYLGIDVSKGYADFVILNSQKQPVVKNFQLDDTFEGHSCLYDILNRFLKNHANSILYAAVESTGGYENNWHMSLTGFQASLNIKTARLNPLGVSHDSQADMKRNKTDKISAQSVAEYLITHPEKVIYQQEDQFANLRKIWTFIQMLTKHSTQFLNQLHGLLYVANPEILRYCQGGIPGWVLKLLVKYPTADKLKRARIKSLVKIPYITEGRGQALINEAKKSVGSSTDPVTAKLITNTINQILHLKKTISAQNDLMSAQCDMPEVKLIKTFVGIGNASAVGLMLEIQSIARFKTAKNLASFFGLHPVYKSSGDGIGCFRMSKQGRKAPRKILFNAMLSAIEYNPMIKDLYQYHLQQGRSKLDAIGICMHKSIRIIYGMLKNNSTFNPEIDKANRERSLPDIKKTTKLSKDRRFQKYNKKAPVSRRQRKKRLERDRSHNVVNDIKRGISAPVPLGDILPKLMDNL